jgi:formyltetrahydrofolate hydrolase
MSSPVPASPPQVGREFVLTVSCADRRGIVHATCRSSRQRCVLTSQGEAMALTCAVRWHAEHRVVLRGRRTIVFD